MYNRDQGLTYDGLENISLKELAGYVSEGLRKQGVETADCEVGPRLIKKAPKSVKRTIGNGAYDIWDCYKEAYEKGQKLIVPPREGAVFNEEEKPWQKLRNDAICQIIRLGNDEEAIKLWKK